MLPLSSAVRPVAESDDVWEKFLPSDYKEILSRLVSPVMFSSKKELFHRLCNQRLMDEGRKSFALERSSGGKSFILSAKELQITWGNDPMYWSWNSIPESRFPKVAELRTMYWLEITGKLSTRTLSPNTNYRVYMIVKISNRAYGLDTMPSEVSVRVGNRVTNGTVYLHCGDISKQKMNCSFGLNGIHDSTSEVRGNEKSMIQREDGWMEIELGEFFRGEDNEEVKMSLKEVKGYHLKGGLIVEGIEVRPMII
ncbi:Phloem protein 2-like [Dillenia turbinata]|uniref:Phloem protein 2-like n=1 Tax=Dillenia turbinata TaxID=194707 RepID=A0AAN8YT29_9MAGN